jgi:hypothetical protein
MIHRIHILGAAGSGTTTLGRALASDRQTPWHGPDIAPVSGVSCARHHHQQERWNHVLRYAGAL